MKVLVTGAGGFLGSTLVRKLLEGGEKDIRCLIRQESSRDRLMEATREYPNANVEVFTGNLTNRSDTKEAVKGVDVVYHCAAAMKGALADMFYNTVVASRNLLDAILENSVKRVVLVSSFSVYGVAELPRRSLVNEETPLETNPVKRDSYSYVKFRQEKLFWDYYALYRIPLVVVRPGVIYGPGGTPLPTRVGINLFGLFLQIGKKNPLPLTYVENCAEAIFLAGKTPGIIGETFNIHDDDIPTSGEYLKRYKNHFPNFRSFSIPYPVFYAISSLYEKYVRYSEGQMPDIFTRYKTASVWKGNKFENKKAKEILNWKSRNSTPEEMERYFKWLSCLGNS